MCNGWKMPPRHARGGTHLVDLRVSLRCATPFEGWLGGKGNGGLSVRVAFGGQYSLSSGAAARAGRGAGGSVGGSETLTECGGVRSC